MIVWTFVLRCVTLSVAPPPSDPNNTFHFRTRLIKNSGSNLPFLSSNFFKNICRVIRGLLEVGFSLQPQFAVCIASSWIHYLPPLTFLIETAGVSFPFFTFEYSNSFHTLLQTFCRMYRGLELRSCSLPLSSSCFRWVPSLRTASDPWLRFPPFCKLAKTLRPLFLKACCVPFPVSPLPAWQQFLESVPTGKLPASSVVPPPVFLTVGVSCLSVSKSYPIPHLSLLPVPFNTKATTLLPPALLSRFPISIRSLPPSLFSKP